jgi:ketosteroid isomerase-like protein
VRTAAASGWSPALVLRMVLAASIVLAVGASVAALGRRGTAVDTPLADPTAIAAVPPPTLPPAAAPTPPTLVPPAPPPLREPLTPADARSLVEAYRTAYAAQDVDALESLFAADATQRDGSRADAGHVTGRGAIAAAYREAFETMGRVAYEVQTPQVALRDGTTVVSAPFVLRYRTGAEETELRGHAEWQVERRDGRAVIAAFDYRYDS